MSISEPRSALGITAALASTGSFLGGICVQTVLPVLKEEYIAPYLIAIGNPIRKPTQLEHGWTVQAAA